MELQYTPCQWPKCNLQAKHNIHYQNESIWVCGGHRGAVMVNIEGHDKIYIFAKEEHIRADAPLVRPGDQKPRYKNTPAPVAQNGERDWQREAAQRAEAAASPTPPVSDLVQPAPRKKGGETLSRAFERLIGEE